MKQISFVFTAIMLLSCLLAPAQTLAPSPDRIPFTIRNTFETGEMESWEAYPYAQDIGYEPYTTCYREPAHNGSKFSLGKVTRPNDIGELEEGFVRELDLWTAAGTRLKAAIFLTSDRKPETLELSLCLFDGRRYFSRVKSPAANRWLELDIPVQSFTANGKPLGAGEHLQAVTIKASYPMVSNLWTYVIFLDDFSLSGERQRRFVGVNPKSTDFDMFSFSILNKHFFYGDALGISVKAEDAPGKGKVSSVTCSLADPSGKLMVQRTPLTESAGTWKIDNAYTFKNSDPRGQWTVRLSGKDPKGTIVEWGFKFLMPGNRLTPKEHPRLYFTADELKTKLANQTEIEKKILANSLAKPDYFKTLDLSIHKEATGLTTEAATGGPYTKIVFEGWRQPMYALSRTIESGAWLYAFTGDKVAGEKAKEAMLRLCAFKMWNLPWQEAHGNHTYYPVGYIAGPIGIGYDLLYPLLNEQEKKAIRDALMEKGIRQFYRDMVEMNRMPSSVTNHISVIVSNFIIDAIAIYGEDPDNPSLEPYVSGILAKMKRFADRTYYPDGGYGEPMGYQDMATRDLVKALPVIEKNFGIDYTTTTSLRDTYLYPLYSTTNDGRMLVMGDTRLEYTYNLTGNTFLWLSYRMKNPWTWAYVQKSLEAGRGGFMGWLWQPRGVTARSREELPVSRYFPVKGEMIMRSSWSDESPVLTFKCGPNSNHYHIDQGHFLLMTNGEALLTEAGEENGYYANLYYPCYDIPTIGHNCLIIDNDADSQFPADYRNGIEALQTWPRIQHAFAGQSFDEVSGDLACVYKGKLDKYTRSLLFVKPDILFLYDQVASPQPHTYSWLFHAEHTNGKSSITATPKTVDIVRPKARLHMDILSPAIASNQVRTSNREESFVTLSTAGGTKDPEFLAVLFPGAVKDGAAPAGKPVSTLLKPSGWTGAKVEHGDTVTLALFRTGTPGMIATVEGYTTDAERFAVTTNRQGALTGLFLRGTSLSGSNGISFMSDRPVSASVNYTANGADIEADATAITAISLSMAKAPSEVALNGAPAKDWKYDAGSKTLKISVPTGHVMVKIR
ncbi:MAG: DUF4962 domain-containing protein [Candidatus Latescibacterota bacterium]